MGALVVAAHVVLPVLGEVAVGDDGAMVGGLLVLSVTTVAPDQTEAAALLHAVVDPPAWPCSTAWPTPRPVSASSRNTLPAISGAS